MFKERKALTIEFWRGSQFLLGAAKGSLLRQTDQRPFVLFGVRILHVGMLSGQSFLLIMLRLLLLDIVLLPRVNQVRVASH